MGIGFGKHVFKQRPYTCGFSKLRTYAYIFYKKNHTRMVTMYLKPYTYGYRVMKSIRIREY